MHCWDYRAGFEKGNNRQYLNHHRRHVWVKVSRSSLDLRRSDVVRSATKDFGQSIQRVESGESSPLRCWSNRYVVVRVPHAGTCISDCQKSLALFSWLESVVIWLMAFQHDKMLFLPLRINIVSGTTLKYADDVCIFALGLFESKL
jgi:hypothetical protein